MASSYTLLLVSSYITNIGNVYYRKRKRKKRKLKQQPKRRQTPGRYTPVAVDRCIYTMKYIVTQELRSL